MIILINKNNIGKICFQVDLKCSVLFLVLLWGSLIAALGIVAVYISRIYSDVRRRPSYIVKDTVGFPPRSD